MAVIGYRNRVFSLKSRFMNVANVNVVGSSPIARFCKLPEFLGVFVFIRVVLETIVELLQVMQDAAFPAGIL